MTSKQKHDDAEAGQFHLQVSNGECPEQGINHFIAQANPEETAEHDSEEAHMLAMCFAQALSLAKGLREFGDRGLDAAVKEIV